MKPLFLSIAVLVCSFHPAAAQEEHPIVKAVAAQLTAPKKKFTMMVELKVRAGEGDKLTAAFAEVVDTVRKQAGCNRYELNQDAADPNLFVVYERWMGIEPLKVHLEAPHTKGLLEKVMPLLDGEPKIRVMVPKADPQKPKPEAK